MPRGKPDPKRPARGGRTGTARSRTTNPAETTPSEPAADPAPPTESPATGAPVKVKAKAKPTTKGSKPTRRRSSSRKPAAPDGAPAGELSAEIEAPPSGQPPVPPVEEPAAPSETIWGADGGAELGTLLAEAHQAVLAREERRLAERRVAERRAAPPRPAPDPVWLAAASMAWLLVAFALLTPPAFMRAPAAEPFRPTPAAAESSARYGLWLARHRVDDFIAREGRLPSFLGEAGMRDPSIRLEVTGERSYRLEYATGRADLQLTDRMAADSFLGNSLSTLRDGE